MTDLGTLGGDLGGASSINDCGQIVGVSRTVTGRQHVFLWQDGVMIDAGAGDGMEANAYAIINRGQIVGARFPETLASSPSQWGQAVLWTK